SVSHDCEILIPAEVVYFPFLPKTYQTRNCFAGGSNGLASGATILEGVNHALYELIERGYWSHFDLGLLDVRALYEHEIPHLDVAHYYNSTNKEFEIQLFSLRMPWIKANLPMILCMLVGRGTVRFGAGCAADVDTAIHRALSEAMQAVAVQISGSREDMHRKKSATPKKETKTVPLSERLPGERTLRIKDLRKEMKVPVFRTLQDEYRYLKRWLSEAGCPEIFIANLTRIGIDIPIVKVVTPGVPWHSPSSDPRSFEHMIGRMYQCAQA
ncbi:MAG TPA: YcaO-like family protein, partial [Bdellovibrionota bacterium]|nr:YcaO-like family protein [Bdellovibrionota bacterium]